MKMLSPHQKQVLELWHKGHSGLRIAQMLGTSRSAVLGLLKRIRDWGYDTTRTIDLNKAEKAAAKSAARKAEAKAMPKKPVERKAPANLVRLAVLRKPPAPPKPKEPEAPKEPLLIKFNDLKPHHCRYVMNNGHASTFLFCGKRKWKGAYCEEHHKIVYVPTIPKKR